ncbi:M20 family metallopeptidase [Fulvivirgaceae bacterium BMA10]|uniref:M20 family metallopeptidase n=1 Tax=Splendidivirga corallicola TaxID=3051826 RepID=A0ABT8KM80_9BACT|nr:M20 family metallopeptidase [Fulvivirgaceae bacterium BMA10]
MLKARVKSLAHEIATEIVEIRRHIHAHPELSFEEHNTVKFVETKLRDFGINDIQSVARTGLTALIKGKNPTSKVIALRADMDALPIEETNDVPYKSKVAGVMHACGHDVHTASLLGSAKILQTLKEEFEGTIKLVFQPGEEKIPGGASLMIKDGALKNPAPKNILGQHVMPLIPVGKVGFRKGMYMASADELYITVKGKGGHAAVPEHNIDPVLITSHIIVALQQIISRHASPKSPTVLSFGKVIANGATNVIPDKVYIEGTFRAMDEKWRAEAHEKMKKMAEGIAEGMGGHCEFNIAKGYPYLQNEPQLTQRAQNAACEYLGEENVVELDIWMGAEDFAFYSQEIDASFYRLGVRNEAMGITSGVHTPTFNIDERALEIGTGLMSWIALNELSSK